MCHPVLKLLLWVKEAGKLFRFVAKSKVSSEAFSLLGLSINGQAVDSLINRHQSFWSF